MEDTYPKTLIRCRDCSGKGYHLGPDREAMKAAREAAGLSQSALARSAGWHASVVSEMESGARPLTEPAAERYWAALREASNSKEETKCQSSMSPKR